MQEAEVAALVAQDVITHAEPITLAFLATGVVLLILLLTMTGRAAVMLREARRLYETASALKKPATKPEPVLHSTRGRPLPSPRKIRKATARARKGGLLV